MKATLAVIVSLIAIAALWARGQVREPLPWDRAPVLESGQEYAAKVRRTRVTVEGPVLSLRQGPPYGFTNIVVADPRTGEPAIVASLWPSQGKLDDAPRPGDVIRVLGFIEASRDARAPAPYQLAAVSKDAILRVSAAKACDGAIRLAEVPNHKGRYVKVGPTVTSAPRTIRSKRGRQHLVFLAEDRGVIIEGIMYEGVWTPQDQRVLGSRQPVCLLVKVGEFRGKISLETQRVEPL